MAENSLPPPGDLLPHRGIALALDALVAIDGMSAQGLWTPDERYYEGHFPDEAILPGHWIMESVALVAIAALWTKYPDCTPLFRENHGKFLQKVNPGSTLELSATFDNVRQSRQLVIAKGSGSASVNGNVVYRAQLIKGVLELATTK